MQCGFSPIRDRSQFGGTSVGDASNTRTAGIVATRVERRDCRVSALAGVTNACCDCRAGGEGPFDRGHLANRGLRDRHLRRTELLLGTGELSTDTASELSAMIDELAHPRSARDARH